jgi:hypothetical protein
MSSLPNRPRLKSHAQPLRRGPGSLQLGLSPDAGVVLDGLTDAEMAVTERLDGSMSFATLYAEAAAAGVTRERVAALIATLNAHHLLVDSSTDRWPRFPPTTDDLGRPPLRPEQTAPAIAAAYRLAGEGLDYVAARSRQHVVISGDGDLPCALADLLRVGGIGEVSVGANAVDVLDLELRGRRGPGQARPGGPSESPAVPDLVVLVAVGALRADAGAPWLRRGIPHLPLVVQAHRVQVGPLITAGTDPVSGGTRLSAGSPGPCLACMDLHRRDRDAAWPALLSQLSPTWPLRPEAPVNLESTLTAMTVGVAAMIVHTCLDGQPVPGDLSLELSLPWPTVLTRRWFRHPRCECAARHATMAG